MADTSVAITPGAGAFVAVETQGGLSYQVVLPGAHQTSPFTETIVNLGANGDNILIAGVAAKRHTLYGMLLYATVAAVNVKITDGAGGTSLFGAAMPLLGIGASWFLPLQGLPYFGPTLTVNTNLIMNLSGANNVSGRLWTIAI